MRNATRLLIALLLSACATQAPTGEDVGRTRLAPPTLSVTATSRALPVPGSASDLQVSALLRNLTTTHIQVFVGAQCPLFVRIFPDPTGEQMGSTAAADACPAGGPTLDLAPGDTAVLTRVIRADALASFAPGTYGINAAVTTNTYLIGVWAGAVQLPLASAP
jgi:hypothetical protein